MIDKEAFRKGAKNGMLVNGLYLSSKCALKSLHQYNITPEQYIERMRILFDEWERLNKEGEG